MSFARTRAALAALDAHEGTPPPLSTPGAVAWLARCDALAWAVWRAFGLDTARHNAAALFDVPPHASDIRAARRCAR